MIDAGPMTARRRFLACMRFQTVDRAPLWEWGPWASTLTRWQRESLGEGGRPAQYDECDPKLHAGVDLWMLPRYEEKILREDDQTVTDVTDRGVTRRRYKNTTSMPEYVDFPVKTRADWEALKKRYDPSDPLRFPSDWSQRCERWRREEPVAILQGARSPSLFGLVRELMGPERTLYAFHDEPDLIHDIMEFNAEFLVALLPRVLDESPLTTIFFWEDMSYRGGSLISPAMFKQFMVPRYRRVTELARRRGIDTIMVDSDGNVEELIPIWLEAGINGVYPMEVAAGMDVAALRKRYGRDLVMTGGIDKRVLARDREAIDEELARCIPVAEQGGYIPHLDHAIPHDVPYENFAYYWQRKKAMLGIG